jgi:uncharacterized membrane protein YdfJ with MMPL/SSD domain
MDLYISHDKSKRLNIYLFGLFFYTSIRIKERVVNLMIKFGKGVVKHRVLILIVAFALLIPSGISFINTRINFDILSYLPSQIETMKGQDIMVDEFGTGALSFVILEDMKDQDIETLADDIEDLKRYQAACRRLKHTCSKQRAAQQRSFTACRWNKSDSFRC